MKFTCCVMLAAVIYAVSYAKPADDEYTTKYDNVDLDAIVKNDRLLRSYVDCLLGTKKCTKDGEELKKVIPDALKTKCSKCNETQKNGAKKIFHHLLDNKREWFNELEVVYDPEGTYRKQYEEEARKEGFNV